MVLAIMTSTGNKMSHSSGWIRNIARSSWYHMDMAVKDCLTCCGADIHPNVESLYRRIEILNPLFHILHEFVACDNLVSLEIEVRGCMSTGYDQRVERCDRKAVPDSERKRVLKEYPILRDHTEHASIFRVIHSHSICRGDREYN